MRAGLHEARAGLYGLLKALFTYPLTGELLERVRDLVLTPDNPLGETLREMKEALRGEITPERLRALNVEMTRLLEGPGVTPAPPFASYYLHARRLMGPAAIGARHFYLEWQALPESEDRIPADHIALELGFLAHLAGRATETGKEAAALEASRFFLERHLLPWLGAFTRALAGAASETFFVGLARFLDQAVRNDLEVLKELGVSPPAEAAPGARA
jgi:TorA-specific chaperone